MPQTPIDGVVIKKLSVICDQRGRLGEILRTDDPIFAGFGQVYFTTAYMDVVKAWHYHEHQTDCFTVLSGMGLLALYDGREGSPTKGTVNEFFIGDHNRILVSIPPRVHHGFKCIAPPECIFLNLPNRAYNYAEPDEIRFAWDDPSIPYSWERKNY